MQYHNIIAATAYTILIIKNFYFGFRIIDGHSRLRKLVGRDYLNLKRSIRHIR